MKVYIVSLCLLILNCKALVSNDIKDVCKKISLDENDFNELFKYVVPELNGKHKGDAGKIAVVGGSAKYTGAPFFAAISALKVGADLVYVITTEDAAPVIKTYSPDLIVVPYNTVDIGSILKTVHVAVIGPGLGREPENLQFAYNTLEICKQLEKPIVIDADGLYAVYKNISVLSNYPKAGAVLTPNHKEATRLSEELNKINSSWTYWGDNVSILFKGEKDKYQSNQNVDWTIDVGGSGRRAGGQGDILAGALGTFLHWAYQTKICDDTSGNIQTHHLAKSIASYAASKLTRASNSHAFKKYGRSMTASDMINEIHIAFDENFL